MDKIHLTNKNLDCAIVTIILHNYCNYRCTYCDKSNYDGSHMWPDDYAPYLKLFSEIKKQNKYITVDLVGGEPTLWPKLQEFINLIVSDNIQVEFATNASRPLAYWEKFNAGDYAVCMSWHSETCDDDHFFKVAEIMQHKANVHVMLLTPPDQFERAQALQARLSTLNIEVNPKFVRKTIASDELMEGYTQEIQDWVTKDKPQAEKKKTVIVKWPLPQDVYLNGKKTRWAKLIASEQNLFKGWECSAGIKRIYVTADGEIYRCTKHVGGSLGNIFKEYSLPTTSVICDKRVCLCKTDAMVEKWNTIGDTTSPYKAITPMPMVVRSQSAP